MNGEKMIRNGLLMALFTGGLILAPAASAAHRVVGGIQITVGTYYGPNYRGTVRAPRVHARPSRARGAVRVGSPAIQSIHRYIGQWNYSSYDYYGGRSGIQRSLVGLMGLRHMEMSGKVSRLKLIAVSQQWNGAVEIWASGRLVKAVTLPMANTTYEISVGAADFISALGTTAMAQEISIVTRGNIYLDSATLIKTARVVRVTRY